MLLPLAFVGMRLTTGALGAPFWVGLIVFFAVLVGAAELLRRYAGGSNLQRIATGLGLRVCPACGYELAGLPVEGDERVVCPECRAAWAAHRLGVPEGAATVPVQTETTRGTARWSGDQAREREASEIAGSWPGRLLLTTPPVFGLDAQGRIVRLADPRLEGVAERLEREEAEARVARAREAGWEAGEGGGGLEGGEASGGLDARGGREVAERARLERAMQGKRTPGERVERVRHLVLPTDGEVMLTRIGWGVMGVVVLLGVVGFLMMAGSASRAGAAASGNAPAGRAGEVAVWFLMVSAALAWVFVVVRGMVLAPRRFVADVQISAMTTYRLCPGCTADLGGAEREDGFLECPGCGAVWGVGKGR